MKERGMRKLVLKHCLSEEFTGEKWGRKKKKEARTKLTYRSNVTAKQVKKMCRKRKHKLTVALLREPVSQNILVLLRSNDMPGTLTQTCSDRQ